MRRVGLLVLMCFSFSTVGFATCAGVNSKFKNVAERKKNCETKKCKWNAKSSKCIGSPPATAKLKKKKSRVPASVKAHPKKPAKSKAKPKTKAKAAETPPAPVPNQPTRETNSVSAPPATQSEVVDKAKTQTQEMTTQEDALESEVNESMDDFDVE